MNAEDLASSLLIFEFTDWDFNQQIDSLVVSTELWLGSEFNGQNKYMILQDNLTSFCDDSILPRGFWSDIILADAIGATTAVMISLVGSHGASAIPNPLFGGIPTAGVIGVLGGAGTSLLKAL